MPVTVDFSKPSNLVKNIAGKKDVKNAQTKDIEDKIPDITNLATNATHNNKINEVKGTIPRTTNIARTTALNAKINEIKGKMPSINNLATTNAFTDVEN